MRPCRHRRKIDRQKSSFHDSSLSLVYGTQQTGADSPYDHELKSNGNTLYLAITEKA